MVARRSAQAVACPGPTPCPRRGCACGGVAQPHPVPPQRGGERGEKRRMGKPPILRFSRNLRDVTRLACPSKNDSPIRLRGTCGMWRGWHAQTRTLRPIRFRGSARSEMARGLRSDAERSRVRSKWMVASAKRGSERRGSGENDYSGHLCSRNLRDEEETTRRLLENRFVGPLLKRLSAPRLETGYHLTVSIRL